MYVIDKNKCCGCGMCANICPQKCITIKSDNEGFLYPEIDTAKCKKCGLCQKRCPVLNAKNDTLKKPTCFACYNKDNDIQKLSSSGGVFSLLAETVLSKNGVVYGASFDGAYRVVHKRINSQQDIDKLRRSKYAQSEMGNIYEQVLQDLNANTTVLFTGTACQISALKNYLAKDYNNLYTQDIICHGVPSQKVWEKYLKENKISKSAKVNFRDKSGSWQKYCVKVEDNKTIINTPHYKNYYMSTFLSNCNLRPSCYDCKFKTMHREADITLGDFWGVEKFHKLDCSSGVSAVMIHSAKGQKLFDLIKDKLKIISTELDNIVFTNPAYFYSSKPHKNRRKFFNNLDKTTVKKLERKYINPHSKKIVGKIVGGAKRIVRKILIKG